MENLQLADSRARKGKHGRYGIKLHDRNKESNLLQLQSELKSLTYRTSDYSTFTVKDPKEREVYRLPYRDRIVHHAIMNILEPVFVSTFTADSYSCIKGKGITAATMALRRSLDDIPGTTFCLKLDIKKFYPSVDHEVLKKLLWKKFKDKNLMCVLEEIVDSAPGVPIGNYLSQYFANFYLTYFDHWIKEVLKVKYYFRYADDIVILSDNKPHLHSVLFKIRNYLSENLKLTVKGNYQVFPVYTQGIDFVGYVHYHTHVLLRKSIKKRFARKVKKRASRSSLAAYYGWAKYCNSKHLLKKLNMNNFKEIGKQPEKKVFEGDKIDMYDILHKEINVKDFKICNSKFENSKGSGKRLDLQILLDGKLRVTWTISDTLMEQIRPLTEDKLPFTTTIIKKGRRYEFS